MKNNFDIKTHSFDIKFIRKGITMNSVNTIKKKLFKIRTEYIHKILFSFENKNIFLHILN